MPTADGFLSLNEASAAMPGRPHRNNVYRWCTEGTLVRGERLLLESKRIGSRVYTRAEWIHAFMEKLNQANGRPSPSRVRRRRTNAEQERHNAEVMREAQELGLV